MFFYKKVREIKYLIMKRNSSFIIRYCLTGFLFLASCRGYSQNSDSLAIQDFKSFLVKWEQCITHFINGDPSCWKQNSSQTDDATIFGAFGGYGEKSWKEVGPRYDWASSQYKPSGAKIKVEYLSIVVGIDLAYTVGIERSDALLGDAKATAPRVLRSTQIFKKENGVWKLLHRHADPLIEKKAPNTN
jgi:ketosteroid isomerase-like protein